MSLKAVCNQTSCQAPRQDWGCTAIAIARADAAGAPEWVQLFPLGTVTPGDARAPWTLKNADAVVAASMAGRDGLPIDYDHQTDFVGKSANQAPAAGWILELAARPDGIWGRVEWTERGQASVAGKEYRFISPVFLFDKGTREITKILRAGLTNDPALTLKALANREASNEEEPMDKFLETLRKLLGLAEDADETAICSAIRGAVEKAAQSAGAKNPVAVALAKACNLAEDASPDQLVAAVTALKAQAEAEPDPAKFVKAETFNEMANRVKSLETASVEEKAAAAVDAAIKAGKLIPGQRDWALASAKRDLAEFRKFVEVQPVLLSSGSTGHGVRPAPAKGALTAEEAAICKAQGVSEDDFKKTRDAETGDAA